MVRPDLVPTRGEAPQAGRVGNQGRSAADLRWSALEGWFLWYRTLHIERAPLDAHTPRQAAAAAIAAMLDLLILDVATLQSNQPTR